MKFAGNPIRSLSEAAVLLGVATALLLAAEGYRRPEESSGGGKGANGVEPDCSPHPFDVMAIYVLYQNPQVLVPR